MLSTLSVYIAYLQTVLMKQFELGLVIDNALSKCYALLFLLQGLIINNTDTEGEFRVHHDQRSTRVARSPFFYLFSSPSFPMDFPQESTVIWSPLQPLSQYHPVPLPLLSHIKSLLYYCYCPTYLMKLLSHIHPLNLPLPPLLPLPSRYHHLYFTIIPILPLPLPSLYHYSFCQYHPLPWLPHHNSFLSPLPLVYPCTHFTLPSPLPFHTTLPLPRL